MFEFTNNNNKFKISYIKSDQNYELSSTINTLIRAAFYLVKTALKSSKNLIRAAALILVSMVSHTYEDFMHIYLGI